MLYAALWWLDATCGMEGWNAVLSHGRDGNVLAALPFHTTRIRGMSAVITPPLTQWVSLITSSVDPGMSLQAILPDLPRSSILDLSVNPDARPLPQESTTPVSLKYSFIIPPMMTMDLVRSNYNEGLRRNIRQAEKNYTITASGDIAGFLTLCEQTYLQRKMKSPPWLHQVIQNVFDQLMSHQCGAITIASSQGKIIAGILTAWDHETSYYLAGGRTGDEQGASAHALLLDHAVGAAQSRGLSFDFEGSMHPGIANFFQSFGAVPISYWQIRQFRGLGKWWSLFQ